MEPVARNTITSLARSFGVVLLVVICSHIYQRYQLFQSLESNAPGKLQPIHNLGLYEIRFADQVRNCEDVLLLEDSPGWALLSCDAGRDKWNTVMGIFREGNNPQGQLYLYNYVSPTAHLVPLQLLDFPAAKTDFHPLGIEYDPLTNILYVVNHAKTGSCIEIFKLFHSEAAASHIRSLVHPSVHSPNSITVLDSENIYMTNDHFFLIRYHRWLATLETYLGIPGGNVVHIHLPSNKVRVVARLPFANGMALVNQTTLAVASTSTGAVKFYSVDQKTHDLKLANNLKVPFLPDNLSIDGGGSLLIGGHAHAISMTKYAQTRELCRYGSGQEAEEACKLTSPTYVMEWTDATGLKTLYLHDEFSTGTIAVRDVETGVGIIPALFDKGILVWKK